ncbi:hypothetical protein VHEMI08132 [[Torrubiella] hemipterigena]|uniref:Glycosyltransferase family 32 protein n=1 Tax=[Torrubiella] hemipterigena TaxID=1531966 RepID=A0A0A1T5M9_9HYPO|nr:hypothetical protein VHEMI08132 [[Torrubiella] hemipterigena]
MSLRNRSPVRAYLTVTIITAVTIISFALYQVSHIVAFASIASRVTDRFGLISECSADNHIQKTSVIPNTIHQIWKDANVSSYGTFNHRKDWQSMFEPLNYTVKLWTEADIRQLIQTKYTWLQHAYDSYPYDIQRADIARLLVVHSEGGMYADLDVKPADAEKLQCLQNLDMEAVFVATCGNSGLSNHWFMAAPGANVLGDVLVEAARRSGSRRPLLPYMKVFWSTGPWMVTAALDKYFARHPEARKTVGLLEEGYSRYAIHHAAGRSWHGADGKMLNYVADHFSMTRLVVFILAFTTTFCILCRCGKRQMFSGVWRARSWMDNPRTWTRN